MDPRIRYKSKCGHYEMYYYRPPLSPHCIRFDRIFYYKRNTLAFFDEHTVILWRIPLTYRTPSRILVGGVVGVLVEYRGRSGPNLHDPLSLGGRILSLDRGSRLAHYGIEPIHRVGRVVDRSHRTVGLYQTVLTSDYAVVGPFFRLVFDVAGSRIVHAVLVRIVGRL